MPLGLRLTLLFFLCLGLAACSGGKKKPAGATSQPSQDASNDNNGSAFNAYFIAPDRIGFQDSANEINLSMSTGSVKCSVPERIQDVVVKIVTVDTELFDKLATLPAENRSLPTKNESVATPSKIGGLVAAIAANSSETIIITGRQDDKAPGKILLDEFSKGSIIYLRLNDVRKGFRDVSDLFRTDILPTPSPEAPIPSPTASNCEELRIGYIEFLAALENQVAECGTNADCRILGSKDFTGCDYNFAIHQTIAAQYSEASAVWAMKIKEFCTYAPTCPVAQPPIPAAATRGSLPSCGSVTKACLGSPK
jgi:hypothetical protein